MMYPTLTEYRPMAKATSTAERKRRKKLARKTAPVSGRSAATTARVAVEKKQPPPTRRMDGLKWLLTRQDKDGKPAPRISAEQYLIGRRYGEICAEAAREALPGKAGLETTGGGFGATLHPHGLAIRTKIAADAIILESRVPPSFAKFLIELLEAVCHRGETLRDLAGGDRNKTLVYEERLKLGLSMLRHLVNSQARGGCSLEAAE